MTQLTKYMKEELTHSILIREHVIPAQDKNPSTDSPTLKQQQGDAELRKVAKEAIDSALRKADIAAINKKQNEKAESTFGEWEVVKDQWWGCYSTICTPSRKERKKLAVIKAKQDELWQDFEVANGERRKLHDRLQNEYQTHWAFCPT
jgi:hypothetical protein